MKQKRKRGAEAPPFKEILSCFVSSGDTGSRMTWTNTASEIAARAIRLVESRKRVL